MAESYTGRADYDEPVSLEASVLPCMSWMSQLFTRSTIELAVIRGLILCQSSATSDTNELPACSLLRRC